MEKIAKAIIELQAALRENGVGEITDFVFANRSDIEKLADIAARDLSLTRTAPAGSKLTTLCGVSLIVAP